MSPHTAFRHSALWLATLVAGAAASAADAFTVSACTNGTPNHSWQEVRTAPTTHVASFSNCSRQTPDPYGEVAHGVGVSDRLYGGVMPPGGELPGHGEYAEVMFRAAKGTRAVQARISRDAGTRSSAWMPYARIDDVDLRLESCNP